MGQMSRRLYVPDRSQKMLDDATMANIEQASKTPFGMSGGVASINKLTAESSSFETGVGIWTFWTGCTFAPSVEVAYIGTHSGKCIVTSAGLGLITSGNIAALVTAGATYTFSAWFKGVVGRSYRLRITDDTGVSQYSTTTVATNAWQRLTVTATLGAGMTECYLGLRTFSDSQVGDVVYWDAIQLEDGSVNHDFQVGQVAWAEDSNFRFLGGGVAPYIGAAVSPLFSLEDSSFEGGTVGTWANVGKFSLANSASDAWHGSKCLQGTITSNGSAGAAVYGKSVNAITAPGSEYTLSAWVKAGNEAAVGKMYRLRMYGDVSGHTYGAAVALTLNWQRITVTKTFDAGDTTIRYAYVLNNNSCVVGDIILADGFQIESGAVAHGFAYGARLSCRKNILNSIIGINPTKDHTFRFLVKTSWPGDDNSFHQLFDTYAGGGKNEVGMYKDSGNNLAVYVIDATGSVKYRYMAVNATNWAPDVLHVIIVIITKNGTLRIFLDGVEGLLSTGAGSGIATAWGVSSHIGTSASGTYPVEGAILAEITERSFTDDEVARRSIPGHWGSRYKKVI